MDISDDYHSLRMLECKGHINKGNSLESKSELDKYLMEDVEDPHCANFEILNWWKLNSEKSRILSKLARDVLAIPVSTVASESAFSTGGRVLNSFRSSLTPKAVQVYEKMWKKWRKLKKVHN